MVNFTKVGCLTLLLVLSSCFNTYDMTNLEIVKSTYEGKTSEENGANLAKYVAKDIKWTEAKGFPYAGTYIGLEKIAKNVFDRLGSEWINYTFTPDTYVADGNIVVAIGTYTGTYKKTNKAFSARVAHFWTLEKRKIVSFEQIVDSKTVAEALNN